jgi:hypothetical protein
MSQVFVAKSDFTQSVIPVHGMFPDLPWISRNALGASYTPLSLPDSAVVQSNQLVVGSPPAQLAANWRNNAALICNEEAERRILEVFPDYMQRNANQDVSHSMTTYGSSVVSSWPSDAQARYNEGMRGWNYVSAVRQTANALGSALPSDPTDNSHWPTVISPPIYIPAV